MYHDKNESITYLYLLSWVKTSWLPTDQMLLGNPWTQNQIHLFLTCESTVDQLRQHEYAHPVCVQKCWTYAHSNMSSVICMTCLRSTLHPWLYDKDHLSASLVLDSPPLWPLSFGRCSIWKTLKKNINVNFLPYQQYKKKNSCKNCSNTDHLLTQIWKKDVSVWRWEHVCIQLKQIQPLTGEMM